MKEFLAIFKEEAEKKQKHALVGLNWSQAVFSVEFEERIPEQEIILEEANEGEQETELC